MIAEYLSIFVIISAFVMAISLSSLGCVVVWQKMAFFGSALAHTTILGIAWALLFSYDMVLMVITATVLVSILLFFTQRIPNISYDTILGIISHGALAIGLLLLSIADVSYINLNNYLFGDILLSDFKSTITVSLVMVIIMVSYIFIWKKLILRTIDKDLATSFNVPTDSAQFIFIILLALCIAVMINILGLLLITSMLLLPAASSRIVSSSPGIMLLYAMIFSIIGTFSGLVLSIIYNVPSSVAIVVCSFLIFIVLHIKYIFIRS